MHWLGKNDKPLTSASIKNACSNKFNKSIVNKPQVYHIAWLYEMAKKGILTNWDANFQLIHIFFATFVVCNNWSNYKFSTFKTVFK